MSTTAPDSKQISLRPLSRREFRGISRRARHLLSMPEGSGVDFKRDLSGIKSHLLVAFANSAEGGALLVGVEEYTTTSGVQRGRVVGCPVDDDARLLILNKASDCIPNIDIQIYVENLSTRPFLRIEIPSGKHKPYCTQKGEYTTRTDARTRALYPDELLNLFMDREGELFLSRFREAATRLEQTLQGISYSLGQDLPDISTHLISLDQQLLNLNSQLGQAETALKHMFDSNQNHSDSLAELLSVHCTNLSELRQLGKAYLKAEVIHQKRLLELEKLIQQMLKAEVSE
ncbi:ATP-binding protein [Pokkaliibacter plantistimulans]|nr:ATP-binding protein [Pokkaliibacter plantistimulans]